MGKTSIEWTDATWNPVRGCSRLSPGCGGANHQGGCYAEKIAARFSGPGQPFEGFAERTDHGGRWTGKMALVDDMLTVPLRWKKPRRIFVNSMSDLFHENLPDEAIDKVFAVMAMAPQHTYQILTKRSARMRAYFEARREGDPWAEAADAVADLAGIEDHPVVLEPRHIPLRQVWLGVSVEDQERADERIPDLLATPAAVRFLSCEPLLGPLDIAWALSKNRLDIGGGFLQRGQFAPGLETLRPIDLAIVGGESGPRSRPFALEWARSIIAQCKTAGVSVFVKQLGAKPGDRQSPEHCHQPVILRDRKGGDMEEWPMDLRVREFPHG